MLPGGPPVWLGAQSKWAFDRVAEYCEGWMPIAIRGELDAAGVRGGVLKSAVAAPTLAYGLAQELLHQGDEEAAREALLRVTQGEVWPAFGYIAAEADLARL